MDFYYLKGILETLFDSLNIDDFSLSPETGIRSFHPGRTAVVYVKGSSVGVIGEIHPSVTENYKITERIYAMQIDVQELIKAAGGTRKVKPLPRYPAVERDIAIVVSQDIPAAEINRVIRKNAGKLLENISLFDIYQGEQIKPGFKSMAFSLKFQATDRTLTDEEVNSVYGKIQQALKDSFNAELRS